MKHLLTGLLFFLAGHGLVLAGPVEVEDIRFWTAPDHTRVVFDTDGPVRHQVFSLRNPDRLVIDLTGAKARRAVRKKQVDAGLIKGMRAAQHSSNVLRIVLDLKQELRPTTFVLKPNGKFGHRLVVDLYKNAAPPEKKAITKTITRPTSVVNAKPVTRAGPGITTKAAPPVSTKAAAPVSTKAAAPIPAKATTRPVTRTAKKAAATPPTKTVAALNTQLRDLVIAIDAGHGGEDPGAIGKHGTREKDVVFSISKRLAFLINKEPGMRAVQIREGDYYVGLRKRINRARENNADLLISIHADGFHDPRVNGSSVYVLSNRGATSEMARWLAEKENSADLAGGVTLDDKDEQLAKVLIDLSQDGTKKASFEVADNLLGELKGIGKTHNTGVQQAGFVVLKSPDIPSILIETAFISNPQEERKLRSKQHQEKLAQAMLRGIRDYFGKHPPPGTRPLARQYVVKSGDTLSHIALRHHVSLNRLRGFNDLKTDVLRVGETLRIPPSQGS